MDTVVEVDGTYFPIMKTVQKDYSPAYCAVMTRTMSDRNSALKAVDWLL